MSDTPNAEGELRLRRTGWRYTRELGVGVDWRASEVVVLSNG